MKKTRTCFSIAAWCLIVFGLIHESAFIYSYLGMSDQDLIVQQMQNFPIEGTDAHIYSFYNGYALLMGVLLISFGIQNLITVKNNSAILQDSSMFLIINILVSLLALAIAIGFFKFIVPVVLTGLSAIFFTLAFIGGKSARD